MSARLFDRDTILDITVNLVPLAILGFFFVVFMVLNPWDGGLTLKRIISSCSSAGFSPRSRC